MKKLIYCALALAAGLFASSCQQENLEPVAKGNTVTYTVQLPDVSTKAIGDGNNVNQLIYEVWRTENPNDVDLVETTTEPKTEFLYQATAERESDGTFKFNVDLVNNQHYTILFWAQVKDGGYYNTTSLKAVTLAKTADLGAFDEARAAFYGTDFINANEVRKATKTVILTRPFGQLNLGTAQRNNQNYTLTVDNTSVTVKGVSKKFNVAAGVASEANEDILDLTFASANSSSAEMLNGIYEWISMNYIFVPANQKPVEVGYTITTNHGSVTNTILNVPTQKNYRTNIVGNLLTSKTDYIVELSKDWEGEFNSVEIAQHALDNATDGTTITLVPGVNYGTLYINAVPGNANTTEVDIADAWAHNYVRTIKNMTIKGAPGAKVDGIVFKTGAQPGDWNVTAKVENLVIENVEFTDAFTASSAGYNAPIMITTSNASVDGLTVKGCQLIGDNSKLNLVYLYAADGSKNVTLIDNTVSGIARLCELRGTENVKITDNIINNTYEHAMLLAGANYGGNVTISGNTVAGISDRFVRMAGAGSANVVIKDNVISNYNGGDYDFIKVTDANNAITTQNNTFVISTDQISTVDKYILNATDGTVFQLLEGNYGKLDFTHTYNGSKIQAKNLTIKGVPGAVMSNLILPEGGNEIINWTISDILFDGRDANQKGIDLRSGGNGLTVENCKFINGANIYVNNYEGITIKKCDFDQSPIGGVYCQKVKDVAIDECKFENMPYNAIQLSGSGVGGNVSILGNKIDNCVSRAMRIVTVDGANLTIKNNKITNSDNSTDTEEASRGQVIKITGPVLTGTFQNNTHNGKALNFANGIATE